MQRQPIESVQDIMSNIVGYLPTLFTGFVVILVGAFVAWLISKLVLRILLLLRLDRVVARMGWGRALEQGDVRHALFGLIGTVIGLFVFLVFLENAILIWKLTVISELLEKLIGLIPELVAAGIILLVGWGVASAVSRAVLRALVQEEFDRARLVAKLVRAAILVFTCAVALVELNIAVGIVTGAFLIAFGALALGFALAFGLGSKRAVELMWEKRLAPPKEESPAKVEPESKENNPDSK
jgi:Mechanosensitive ion channel, conserved TM helix